jgi:hypothetical protein
MTDMTVEELLQGMLDLLAERPTAENVTTNTLYGMLLRMLEKARAADD